MGSRRESVEERSRPASPADVIDLGKILGKLRPFLWRIFVLSIVVGVIVLAASFLLPNQYRAEATVAPAAEETKPNFSLGALASSVGISLGAPTQVEDLESLFKSRDLTVRVFERNSLWPLVAPDRYDPDTGTLAPSLRDRLFRGAKEERPPDAWQAIWLAEEGLRITVNRKVGTLEISFESVSPEGAAEVVHHYLVEAKSRLQEEAFKRAAKNKKFIEEQIGRIVDPLTRDRLYALYGQEVEREMMARNREQFAFTVIDSPRVPVRKSGPWRALIALFAALGAASLTSVILLSREGGSKDR
jgi:uncharacterized protein involved in exopolysaccharide biosynthesis